MNNENTSPSASPVSVPAQPQSDPGYVYPYPVMPYRYTPAPPPQKPDFGEAFGKKAKLYAVSALILGFLFVKTFLKSTEGTGFGLMMTVVSILLTVFSFLFSRSLGGGSKACRVIFAANLLLSPSFLLCDNGSVTVLCGLMIFLGCVYYPFASFGEGKNSVLHNAILAVLISPLSELGAPISMIFKKSGKKAPDKGGSFKKYIPAAAGLLLSVPVCIAAIFLLSQADESFADIFSFDARDIAEWISEHIIANIFIFAFSLPVGMYIFSAIYSRAVRAKLCTESESTPRQSLRILPASMCAAFLTPLALIYACFTAIQIHHIFAANVLGQPDFTYSSYAREGFFQLCAVTIINLGVISAVMFFARFSGKALPRTLRCFIAAFALLTHCLIATALSKMLLYIDTYGMTPKRVHTSVFMIFLFIMFAVLIVKQIKPRISFTKIGYILAALVLAAMAFIPVDALIARYNIRMYESGDIPWMGESAMRELDASAVSEYEALFSLESDPGLKAQSSADSFFGEGKELARSYRDMTLWDLNIARAKASRVMLRHKDHL